MKIAVSSQNFHTVTSHAGRARRFLIYAVEPGTEPSEVDRLDLPKELSMHEFHGGGAHPLDSVDVLITGSYGEGFARRMAERGILAVTTQETDPIAAVKAYVAAAAEGKTLPQAHACCHGHGHGQHQHHHHQHGHHHGGHCRAGEEAS